MRGKVPKKTGTRFGRECPKAWEESGGQRKTTLSSGLAADMGRVDVREILSQGGSGESQNQSDGNDELLHFKVSL